MRRCFAGSSGAELVTNAVRHARGQIELTLGRHDDRIRVEVRNAKVVWFELRDP